VEVHYRHESKSISRSTTLPEDIFDIEKAKSVLLQLAEEVGAEARKYGYKGKTVSIVIKYGDFQTITRQKTVIPTYLTKEIYNAGKELLETNWNRHRGIRLLGIGLSGFNTHHENQLPILDDRMLYEINTDDRIKEEKLERAVDSIRDRFGTDKVMRARTYYT